VLSHTTITTLFHAADVAVPLEMCGLLFSEQRFQPCKNVSFNPWHEFEIAHEEFLHHMADYGEAPWAIVHSHPRTSAHLSPKDCRLLDAMQITKTDMAMVIVSVQAMELKVYDRLRVGASS